MLDFKAKMSRKCQISKPECQVPLSLPFLGKGFVIWFLSFGIPASVVFLAFIGIMGMGTASAELKPWVMSDWELWGEVMSAVDATAIPGSIQPVESFGVENIVENPELKWHFGEKPGSFTKEHDAYIWTNSPALNPRDWAVVDGDETTSTEDDFKGWGANQTGRTFYFDLGRMFSASRIVFYPRQTGEDESGHPYKDDYLRGFDLFISDGRSFDLQGQPIYRILTRKRGNTQSIVEISFPLQSLRFVKLRSAAADPFEIAEFEIYGEGFAPKMEYTSKVLDLKGIANYGTLEWRLTKWRRVGEDSLQASDDAQVSVRVRMRSGNDPTPVRYRAKGDTTEITKTAYDNLKVWDRDPDTYDRTHWSFWSVPHSASDERIILPSPRRYFQFSITLESGSVREMARVDSFLFWYSTPPLADKVVAEIALAGLPDPPEEVAYAVSGEPSTLTYDLKAEIVPSQYGFDGLRIVTPNLAVLRELSIGNSSWVGSEVRTEATANRLTIFLPHRITHDNNPSLRVTFDTTVLVYGTIFSGEVFNTGEDELSQPVVEGNANDAVSTDKLGVRVFKSSVGRILSHVDVFPDPLTPNEDGIHDSAVISYTITDLIGEAAVKIEIYDLSGVRVRSIPLTDKKSGVYDDGKWDGRDDDGGLVPPGVYLWRVSVETDVEVIEKVRTIAVIY